MAKKRLTDVSKWDDDWYLDLPPRMKCAWEILENTCEGTGFKKISFGKLSRDVGEKVTREDFDKYYSDRIHWIDSETVWVFSYIATQYKELSPKNAAHLNIARLVVKELSGQSLSDRARKIFVKIENLFRESPDPNQSIGRGSGESRPTHIEYRIQNIENRKEEEGVGETRPDLHLAAEHYCDQFQKTQKTQCAPFLKADDYSCLIRMLELKGMTLDRLKKLINAYLTMPSEWFDKMGRSLLTLEKNINVVLLKAAPAHTYTTRLGPPLSKEEKNIRAEIETAMSNAGLVESA
jgi:hypothetical protein